MCHTKSNDCCVADNRIPRMNGQEN